MSSKDFIVKNGLQVNGNVTFTGTITGDGSGLTGISGFSGSYSDLTDKPTLFSGSYSDLTDKPTIPAELVSGTNIKTINGQSILGSGDLTIQGGGNGLSSGGSTIYVKGTGTDAENGAEFRAAYTQAATLVVSLGTTVTIIVAPGRYDINNPSTFYHSASDVNIISLLDSSEKSTVFFMGDFNVDSFRTYIKGIEATGAFKVSDGSFITCEDCRGGNASFGGYANSIFGTFINCHGGNASFATGYNAGGTFENCTCGSEGFGAYGGASGTFTNCVAGINSFGSGNAVATASGTFTNCTGYYSFGVGSTASGTFINCIDTAYGFGWSGILSGKLYNCRSEQFATPTQGGELHYCVATNGGTAVGLYKGVDSTSQGISFLKSSHYTGFYVGAPYGGLAHTLQVDANDFTDPNVVYYEIAQWPIGTNFNIVLTGVGTYHGVTTELWNPIGSSGFRLDNISWTGNTPNTNGGWVNVDQMTYWLLGISAGAITARKYLNADGTPFSPSITSQNVTTALGYTPVKSTDLKKINNVALTATGGGNISVQTPLVSGTNIKTINGTSLLGSGNIVISGGTGGGGASTTEADDFTIKNSLIVQLNDDPIGAVTAFDTIPLHTQTVTYNGDLTNTPSTAPIVQQLNFGYGGFFGSYADIYLYTPGNYTELQTFFAVGNTVRITRDGHWWDTQITNNYNNNDIYFNIQYTITNASDINNYPTPDSYQPYWYWSDNISFSTNDYLIPTKYTATFDNPVIAMTQYNKILINGAKTETPYSKSITYLGFWQAGPTPPYQTAYNEIILGCWADNTTDTGVIDFKEVMQVGNTVSIISPAYGNADYLVTSVGSDSIWGTQYGIKITLQYVSGTNYETGNIHIADVFGNFQSISTTVTPNLTTKYLSNFTTLDPNDTSLSTYISTNDFSAFLSVGDVLSYIKETAKINFKDDDGNKVKSITYNNKTGKLSYDDIVQTLEYDAPRENLYSINANAQSKTAAITNNRTNNIAIGYDARTESSSNGIAIGNASYASDAGAVAIGAGADSGYSAVAIGNGVTAYNQGVSIGYGGTNANGYGSVAIGRTALAYGDYSTAIGYHAKSFIKGGFVYATSGDGSWTNQRLIVTYLYNGYQSWTGSKYISVGAPWNSSTTPNSSDGIHLPSIGGQTGSGKAMAIATAKIMMKPINNQSLNAYKIVEIKFAVRVNSSSSPWVWALDIISTNTLLEGSDTAKSSQWTPSFEIYNNNYLLCKINKGTDNTAVAISAKVEFDILETY